MLAIVYGAREQIVVVALRRKVSVLAAKQHYGRVLVAERADHVSWLSQRCGRRETQKRMVRQEHVEVLGQLSFFRYPES
jgi:hypothetical protein